jgi:hypothetical protein
MISFKAMAAATAAVVVVIGSGMAMAKDAAPHKTATVHSPESIECSKQADAKGLHGKERKTFRAHCKKDLEKNKKS